MKIIFLGSQGSGKSTQAKLLAQNLDLPYIEMGQLLRDRAKETDAEATVIRKALDTGNLVLDELAIKTLKRRLKNADCQNGYILDGYPRNYAQLRGYGESIDQVFYIKVSDQESLKRLLQRAREDDTLVLLTKRLKLYHQKTKPLLACFKKEGVLEELDGERSIEAIAQDVAERVRHVQSKRQ